MVSWIDVGEPAAWLKGLKRYVMVIEVPLRIERFEPMVGAYLRTTAAL